ncbi:unnamed protein product, partial [Discosporangium mesarthrocarpum]
MFEGVRHAMAVFVTIVLPVVLVFWLVIHGGISLWRKFGTGPAYICASLLMLLAGLIAWTYRGDLVGTDLGYNPALLVLGALVYAATIVFSRPIRRHLSLRTFAGVPEIGNE